MTDITTPELSNVGIRAKRCHGVIGLRGPVFEFVYLERGDDAVTFRPTKADMLEGLETKRNCLRLNLAKDADGPNVAIYRAHVSILEDAIAAGFRP